MRRFLVNGSMKLYYPTIEDAARSNPDASNIEELPAGDEIAYSEIIICDGTVVAEGDRGDDHRILIHKQTPMGLCEVLLFRDNSDGRFYDMARTRLHRSGRVVHPVLWDVTTPEKAYRTFFAIDELAYEVLSSGSKVQKPSELKGVKPIASVKFCNRAACQIFVKGRALYIKHADYFSPTYCKPEDVGTPLSFRANKYNIKAPKDNFVYNDNWGAIVLRRNAWVKIDGCIPVLYHLNAPEFSRMLCKKLAEHHGFASLEDEWLRFFESVSIAASSVLWK